MSTNTDYLLAVEDLTVSFDGFKAVDSLTFYVDSDELRVIIGPNGAGKTTVLDLISGKTPASEGSIKFKKEREATADLLKRVSKGRSIIIIEHDMDFVERIANRVTVLHMGKILAEGNMAEIKANETVKKVYLGD